MRLLLSLTKQFLSFAGMVALLAACAAEPETSKICPQPGHALARRLMNKGIHFSGPNAVGGGGDYLLQSQKAAFIVSGIDRGTTYYHYGGILVDAVAMRGCHQASPDQFEELGLLLGKLNVGDFYASTLRAFRGQKVSIVNDGANGQAAHVRVEGVDDYYWLAEYELIKQSFVAGKRKPLSSPYGIRMITDYILDPQSAVLQVRLTLRNETTSVQRFMAGPEMIVGDLLRTVHYGDGNLEFGGFNMLIDIPFWTAGSAEGSYAFSIQNGRLSTTNISGVNANIDVDQAIAKPLTVQPGGEATMSMLFAVGDSDHHSAARELQPYLPQPLAKWNYKLTPLTGTVRDRDSGQPVSGATVDVQLQRPDGQWLSLERYIAKPDGSFGPDVADFGRADRPARLVVTATGRNAPPPVALNLPLAGPLDLRVPPAGEVRYTIQDDAGTRLPAKISFFRDGSLVAQHFVIGEGAIPVAPGLFDVWVTRGFEYQPYHTAITVPEAGTATLHATLPHVVDTSGYLSADTHVHAAPSPDSEVPIPLRILTAAAEGLDIPVSTDHEIIIGLQSGIVATGLQDWVGTVSGEEFTATIPEHVTIFPVDNDGTLRGSPPVWYQHGLGELFEAAYGRGAKIALLNHPRFGCSYLCLIDWDRITGEPRMNDPAALGLPADATLWTWNFHGIEYMNGVRTPFRIAGRERESGLFDDWQAFLNLGHRMVAVGASDEHGLTALGMPRIYFGTTSDQPALFHPQNLVDAFFAGDVLVSTGAFARVQVNGQGRLGDVIVSGPNVALNVRIEAIPEIDVTHFRVYVNCDERVKTNTISPDGIVKFDGTINLTLTRDAHITVSGFGEKRLPPGLPQFEPHNIPRFTTNAIYVDVDGNGVFDPPGGKTCLYTLD